jgi:hypothetical protein
MRRERNGELGGFIYVLHNMNRNAVKIGYSGNPMSRIAQLRTASPDPLALKMIFEGTQEVERRLHRTFAAHRLNGEWFDALAVTPRRVMAEVGNLYPEANGDRACPCDDDYPPPEVLTDLDTGEEIEVFDLRPAAWIDSKPHLYCVWAVQGEESGEGESGGLVTYYAMTEDEITPPDPTDLIVVATEGRYRFWAIDFIRPIRANYGE